MRSLIVAALLLTSSATAFAQPQADVQKAAQSVYRIWLGIPLPTGFLKQTDSSHIQSLQINHYADNVPLKGMTLRNKKTGKIQALSGEGILFEYSGDKYLLLTTGSAYAVSNKGHLVSNARFADNIGDNEAMFVDEGGLRDMGSNGGQARAFILSPQSQSHKLDLKATEQITRDTKNDIAILQAKNLPTTALKLADSQFAKPADLVYALGAEGESNALSGKHAAIDRIDYAIATASEGTLDKRITPKNVNMWQHSAPFSGSVSGGALVNQCGQVLGTNQISDNGTYRAIDVGVLLPMLNKHSIPFEQFQGRCGGVVAKAENIADGAERVVKAAQHNPRGWLTVLGLVVATFIASIIALKLLFWLWRKRKQNRVGSHSQNHAQNNPQANSPNHAHNPTRNIAAPNTVRHDNNALVLQAVSGSLNTPINVPSNRAIIVGRRDDCDVVLAHPKISGQHAKLWLDNGILWIQDLNSTNGTFINGAPIRSASRLQAGDELQFTGDNSVAIFKLNGANAAPRTQYHQPQFAAILCPDNPNLPTISVPFSGSLKIGRANDNDVMISVPQVSGRHCRVSADANGTLWLEDVGSTNGTFVDDLHNRISQKTPLRVGQVVYLADNTTVYRVQAA